MDGGQGQVRLGTFALEKHGELAIRGEGRVRTWLRNVAMVLQPRRAKKTFSRPWLDEVAYRVGFLLQALCGPTVILRAQVAGTGGGKRQLEGPPVGTFLGPGRIIAHVVSRGRFELCSLCAPIVSFPLAAGVADAAGAG